jgi:hypothetical protein
MSDPNTPIPSVETDEISDLDLGPGFLSQHNNMNRDSYFLNIGGNIYGRRVTAQRINPLNEQIRPRPRQFDFSRMELPVDLMRREFLLRACITSIAARLELISQIYKEMEAYDGVAAKIRNVVGPKCRKAHENKDTNAHDWENAWVDMHDALISASKSLQELEVNIFVGLPGTALTWTIETL